jgi:hypothetical protein
MSPINVRAPLGAGEACGLYLVGGMVPFQPGDSRALGELARFAKKGLSASQTFQSLSTSLHGLEAIMAKDMDVEAAARLLLRRSLEISWFRISGRCHMNPNSGSSS